MSSPHRATSPRRAPEAAPGPVLPGILAALGTGRPCAAVALAAQLGVTRDAVRRQIGAWRRAGLEIESGPDGYRLAAPIVPLDPVAIRARLPAVVRQRVGAIENHWRVDSTSSECVRRARGLADRSFVFAEWQAAGRGRRGRRWLAPPGSGVQVSCLKRFERGYAALSGLSLAVGVAVADALADCGVAGIGLKWPNDLVVADAKLGGILVELGGDAAGACHAVIGIGINVRLPPSPRATLARAVVDLADLAGGTPPVRGRVAAALIARLVPALDAFAEVGYAGFAEAWAARDVLSGRRVRVACGRTAFDGVAAGADRFGALRVRCADGVRSVDAAEVSVRAQ